ncbi:hypothetical protein BG015_011968 [Linnemannia schmuckeri]|uniref:Kelch repeat-containing protein n=1 Tax=Linnemannia schmuckeri TaxID=64567 RepID=A0A9P5VE81_9FUNG|nr:hypothetical protein BG015_011968 [Linnemannia schmuckeri]
MHRADIDRDDNKLKLAITAMNWSRQSATQRFSAWTSFLITVCLISTLSTQHLPYAQAQSYSPTVVAAPAFARTITKLYVAGGAVTPNLDTMIRQFMYLDLLKPFTSTAPPWTQLANCPAQHVFPAAFSSDEKILYIFHVPGTNSPWQYSVVDDTWQEVTATKFGNADWEGIGAVTDPKSGLIYLAGGYDDVNAKAAYLRIINVFDPVSQTINTQDLPPPEKVFPVRWYYGNVWSRNRSSIVYWGGVNRDNKVSISPVENGVTEFTPDLMSWFTMPIQGVAPTVRADHCMAANDDGTKIAIYGGRFRNRTITGELWILDLVAYTWIQGLSGPPRCYTACTIAGDQFLVWGGGASQNEMAPSEMLIYDFGRREYVKKYTPPTYYKDLSPPPALRRVTAPWPTKTSTSGAVAGSGGTENGTTREGTSSAIVGGILGGLALLSVFVGIFFLRRRRREQKWRAVTGADQAGQGDVGVESSEKGPWKEPQGVTTKHDPQATEQDYNYVDKTLQELVEQQRQLEHKRQLLILKQQGLTTNGSSIDIDTTSQGLVSVEQLRGPAVLPGAKSEYLPPLPSTSSSSPTSTPQLSMSSTPLPSPESLYADLLLSTAALTTKPTVQMIPSLVANDGNYVDGYEGARQGVSVGKESDLEQMIEPIYGPVQTVSNVIPDVVYMPSLDAGVDWTKHQQDNHPHTIAKT